MATSVARDWIASEFSKGIDAERTLAADARARAQDPPDPALAVLYNEIAAADERHVQLVETVAIRYGHTPSRGVAGGIGETLSRLKEKVVEMATTSLERVGHDMAAKANSIHWYTAWIATFEAIGDTESARELAAALTEEKAHRDALQEGLNRLVEKGARGELGGK
jgi:ferritin-like metal-binding protein YciE